MQGALRAHLSAELSATYPPPPTGVPAPLTPLIAASISFQLLV
ncbi:hypothetical protein SynA1825c_02185 [Synechococcus sp. A18-25c]|nr:hypothetical protein SynA1560_02225 [Synechococcus sp. A15-60]QNJ20481.1 hypothetical protein SynA1825c_02185 [Synechococcus sp. A18-25c]